MDYNRPPDSITSLCVCVYMCVCVSMCVYGTRKELSSHAEKQYARTRSRPLVFLLIVRLFFPFPPYQPYSNEQHQQ